MLKAAESHGSSLAVSPSSQPLSLCTNIVLSATVLRMKAPRREETTDALISHVRWSVNAIKSC